MVRGDAIQVLNVTLCVLVVVLMPDYQTIYFSLFCSFLVYFAIVIDL